MPSNDPAPTEENVLEFTRLFEAPRSLLFKLWGDPAHLVRWWGPEGHGIPEFEVDFREGGRWATTIFNPDGSEARMHGVYTEVTEPSRLGFTYLFEAANVDSLVEIDFIERGASTEIRFRQAPLPSIRERDNHSWGWNSSFDVLTQYLKALNPIDGQPWGERRRDGVVADMLAARERQASEARAPTKDGNKGIVAAEQRAGARASK